MQPKTIISIYLPRLKKSLNIHEEQQWNTSKVHESPLRLRIAVFEIYPHMNERVKLFDELLREDKITNQSSRNWARVMLLH